MFGPGCCCEPPPDCPGFCADATNVTILVDLAGFADGYPRADPPGLGSCLACDDLNQTYALTFFDGDPGSVPAGGCATTDENGSIPACFYMGGYSCVSTSEAANFFRNLAITLRVYVTNGGDRRGYLQLNYLAYDVPFIGSPVGSQNLIIGRDFLIESGATETDCLAFTLTDEPFDQECDDTTTPADYDCVVASTFSLTVVEA